MQVLKNLLSNAFKFTEHGGVRLTVAAAASGWNPDHPVLKGATTVVAFEVSDTGIGIPPEKQRIVFEAFQQADAEHEPQVRRHGPRARHQPRARRAAGRRDPAAQHARRGQHVHALPAAELRRTLRRRRPFAPSTRRALSVGGRGGTRRLVTRAGRGGRGRPRAACRPGDAVLLVVEDDPHYGRVLGDLARDKGFKVLVATRGVEGLALAREYRPTAVSLDVFLPDMLGWTVLSQLKQDPTTRHIPVQMVTLDEDRQHGLDAGRVRVRDEAGHVGGPRGRPRPDQGLRDGRAPAPAGRRGRRRRADEHPRAARPRRHRDRSRPARAPRRSPRCGARAATAWCSTCGCPTCPASRCSTACATTRRCATCPSSSSPARS